jgi:hypothetical protein
MLYVLSVACGCFAVVAGISALCAMAISDYKGRARRGR